MGKIEATSGTGADNAGKAAPRSPSFGDAALLAAISSLGPFAANTYVPAFGTIAADLGTTMVGVQQTLSVYLAAYAVSALFVGAISDAVGRKPVIIAATLVFAGASIGAMFADSLEALYCWRVLQGMCASVGAVLSQAVIRDRWDGADAARLIGLTAILFALAPAAAPVAGGWITLLAGWRAVFAFLALFNVCVALLVWRCLKESLERQRRQPFRAGPLLSGYFRAVRHKAFMAGALGHGFAFLGTIVYSAGAADFVLHIMARDVNDFGLLMVPLVAATMVGAFIGPRIMARIGNWRLIFDGILVMVASGILGIWLELEGVGGYPAVIVFPMIYNVAVSAVRPVMNVMNLDWFPTRRGLAASIQQFCLTMAFCLSSSVFVPLVMGEAWKYSAVMLGAALMTACLWLVVRSAAKRAERR